MLLRQHPSKETSGGMKFTVRGPNTISVNSQLSVDLPKVIFLCVERATDELPTGLLRKRNLRKSRLSVAVGELIDQNWLIGRVREEVDEDDGETCVKFVKRGRSAQANFIGPERVNILGVTREDTLCVIELPSQSSKTRRTFQLSQCYNNESYKGKVQVISQQSLVDMYIVGDLIKTCHKRYRSWST